MHDQSRVDRPKNQDYDLGRKDDQLLCKGNGRRELMGRRVLMMRRRRLVMVMNVDLARVSMLITALTEVAKLERSLGCNVEIK